MKCEIAVKDEEYASVLIHARIFVPVNGCGCKSKPLSVTEQQVLNNLQKRLVEFGVNVQPTRTAGAWAVHTSGQKIKEIATWDTVVKITKNHNK